MSIKFHHYALAHSQDEKVPDTGIPLKDDWLAHHRYLRPIDIADRGMELLCCRSEARVHCLAIHDGCLGQGPRASGHSHFHRDINGPGGLFVLVSS